MDSDEEQAIALREEAISRCAPLAEHISQRFAHRGEPIDDLRQVALVGLIHAVDRFDPSVGADFLAFAVPTIMGEVRRHFRDTRWAVRMPRRLQEAHLAIGSATSELVQQLGREPTQAEIAEALDLTVSEVEQGQLAGRAFVAQSADAGNGQVDDDRSLFDTVGSIDTDLEQFEEHEALQAALEELPARERSIIIMRFFGNKTQAQIAEHLGISQMHVSRLLARTLGQMRSRMIGD
ncbi:SigB/SigF/SigG family RNA polymerase sigma factor [Lolliginicoccus suaedae]|uniref:SigB/SigF/SigG family RNA polymerase sigma factor n=1 Tax=Lolliginicoccus suaedae TaxID=2605429 RepID=UPI0011ECF32B|nr:SigB/SigF/SigG family RNA polymerase sigma factor [Lolliginicoccus suaedae]